MTLDIACAKAEARRSRSSSGSRSDSGKAVSSKLILRQGVLDCRNYTRNCAKSWEEAVGFVGSRMSVDETHPERGTQLIRSFRIPRATSGGGPVPRPVASTATPGLCVSLVCTVLRGNSLQIMVFSANRSLARR